MEKAGLVQTKKKAHPPQACGGPSYGQIKLLSALVTG